MPTPTPVAEQYVSCVGAIFNIGGVLTPAVFTAGVLTTPGSVAGGVSLEVLEGGYKRSYAVKDMTNNQGAGWSSDVKTIRSLTGTFKIAYIAGTPPLFNEGDLYAVIIFHPTTTASASGTVRFNEIDEPILNVQDGLVYGFSIKNQGPMTVTN